METTATEKDDIRTIIQKLADGDREWLTRHEIVWGDKGPFWIVNYQQGGRNQYNRLVRGMVISKPPKGFQGDLLSLIRSFPFTRFYNQGEKDAAHVDFTNAEMLEKMDGTMVGVFFPHGDASKPEFHTRKMLSTHQDDMNRKMTTFQGKEAMFLPEIQKFVHQLKFSKKDAEYTFVFEFIHEISYVLTKYKPEQHGLYLLGARNIKTHRELTEEELDQVAGRIGCRRGRRWDAQKHHAEIEQLFADIVKDTPDFEGFVFRDKTTGNRVKVKDPEYVRKHHLLDGLNYKRLIPRVLEGEEDEVLAYFPHAKELIDNIKESYANYLNKVTDSVYKWSKSELVNSRKLLAQHVLGPDSGLDGFEMKMVMKHHGLPNREEIYKAVDTALRQVALGHHNDHTGNPKRLADMIGLHDAEEDENAGVDIGEL